MTDMRTAPGPTRIPAQGGAAESAAGGVGTSEPAQLTDEQLKVMVSGNIVAAGGEPQLMPPGTQQAAGAGAATATWRTNVQVTATWMVDETRNAFVYLDGIGWKKVFNGTDGAFSALVALAAQARETGRNVSAREEADGMIHEIYLW